MEDIQAEAQRKQSKKEEMLQARRDELEQQQRNLEQSARELAAFELQMQQTEDADLDMVSNTSGIAEDESEDESIPPLSRKGVHSGTSSSKRERAESDASTVAVMVSPDTCHFVVSMQ